MSVYRSKLDHPNKLLTQLSQEQIQRCTQTSEQSKAQEAKSDAKTQKFQIRLLSGKNSRACDPDICRPKIKASRLQQQEIDEVLNLPDQVTNSKNLKQNPKILKLIEDCPP